MKEEEEEENILLGYCCSCCRRRRRSPPPTMCTKGKSRAKTRNTVPPFVYSISLSLFKIFTLLLFALRSFWCFLSSFYLVRTFYVSLHVFLHHSYHVMLVKF